MKGVYKGLTNAEYMRLYRAKNPERVNAVARKSYRKRKMLLGDKFNERERQYRTRHKEVILSYQRRYMKEWSRKAKIEVLTYYGGGKCACVKCGFGNIVALSIDHVNNNGCKHRQQIQTKGGWSFYRWLIKHSFPRGYQTLCMNCQFIKQYYKLSYESNRH